MWDHLGTLDDLMHRLIILCSEDYLIELEIREEIILSCRKRLREIISMPMNERKRDYMMTLNTTNNMFLDSKQTSFRLIE
jgi:hypothetical protein